MKEGVLFFNPKSGSFPQDEEDELRQRASDSGLEVVEIRPEIDVAEVARKAVSERRHTVVVCGGDGSIHHVVQALVGTEGILGVIPLGTMNHLAHDMGVPFDWREALEVATRGEIQQIDTGRVNGEYFLNTVSIGIYPTVSQYRERFRSTHSKWRAYAKGARMALRRFRSISLMLEIDGEFRQIVTPMFLAMVNERDLEQVGMLLPRTSFSDGRLTLYTLPNMSRLEFAIAAGKYLRGKAAEVDGFRSMRALRIKVDTGRHRLHFAMDGELKIVAPPLLIEVVPSSLLIRVPRAH